MWPNVFHTAVGGRVSRVIQGTGFPSGGTDIARQSLVRSLTLPCCVAITALVGKDLE
jgi:hypothetical protein